MTSPKTPRRPVPPRDTPIMAIVGKGSEHTDETVRRTRNQFRRRLGKGFGREMAAELYTALAWFLQTQHGGPPGPSKTVNDTLRRLTRGKTIDDLNHIGKALDYQGGEDAEQEPTADNGSDLDPDGLRADDQSIAFDVGL